MVRIFFLVGLLFPMMGHAQDASLVGRWFGQDTLQKPGYLTQWIGRYNADGSFVINYRSFLQCALMTRTQQEGRWSLDGSMQTNQIERADSRPSSGVGRYEMLEVTPDIRRYRSLRTQLTYEAKRVDETFQLPVPSSCAAQ